MIELGSRLVAQLNCDRDLLTSWMAHYVAELIEMARTSPTAEREAAQERCAEAILHLWKQRTALPDRARPLIELEPVLRTLAALAADRDHPWYFRQILQPAENGRADDETKKWLGVATHLDSTARSLIRWVLHTVTKRIAAPTRPWMELAAAASIDDDVDTAILRAMLEDSKKVGDASVEALKDKLSQLEEFAGIATAFANDLRDEISVKETDRDTSATTTPSAGEESDSHKTAPPNEGD